MGSTPPAQGRLEPTTPKVRSSYPLLDPMLYS